MSVVLKRILIAVLLAFLFPMESSATSLEDVRGTWALHFEGKAMIVLQVSGDSASPTGSLAQPKSMNVTNDIFVVPDNKVEHHSLVAFADKGEFALASFRDSSGKMTDFELRPKPGGLEVGLAGVPPGAGLGPWLFVAAARGETVATDWQAGRSYVPGDSSKPSAEMAELFRVDQSVREKSPIDWSSVSAGDASRRKRTLELLSSGDLHTGSDYKEAAFIMQHGTTPDDYLLAHSLALVAMAKGESSAAWIAAASMDRFLWSKNLPQIYGTQSKDDWAGNRFREPYAEKLIDGHIKRQLGAVANARD